MPSRREFLQGLAAVSIGVGVSEIAIPVKTSLNEWVKEETGMNTGNAYVRELIEEDCKKADDVQECVEEWEPSPALKIQSVVVAPVLEEANYRAFPSFVSSLIQHQDEDLAVREIFTGEQQHQLGMGRRDLIIGAMSTIVFGFMHNITESGIDTKTIPASQMLGGGLYWYLQRKLGIVSNIAAHVWNNWRAM